LGATAAGARTEQAAMAADMVADVWNEMTITRGRGGPGGRNKTGIT
jgi:hypothetical protein